MRNVLTAGVILLLSQTAEAASTQYVDFINDSESSVISIELATSGSEDWMPITLNGDTSGDYVSLEGGFLGQAMTAIDTDRGCVYDVRIDFADHQPLLLTGLNVCRTHALHIGQQWRRAILENSHASA
jgi:hypothetical protein